MALEDSRIHANDDYQITTSVRESERASRNPVNLLAVSNGQGIMTYVAALDHRQPLNRLHVEVVTSSNFNRERA